jgi:chromate transporter
MYRDLVERRAWIGESDYKEGLTLAQLMPGPLAAQLAIYLGYVDYRILGATLVGIAFVLPSFLMVVAIGAAYVAFGGIAWMQAVFYGVGACVIGIIAISAYKLTTKSIGKDKLLWASTSRTANPSNIDTLVNEVADATAKEMKKQGFLAP